MKRECPDFVDNFNRTHKTTLTMFCRSGKFCSSGGQLANLSAPMFRVGIAFQVAVNFLLMVEVVSQRQVKLRVANAAR